MNTRQLLNFGTITAILFWLSTIIAGFLHGHYNHLTDTVSELGALGTRSNLFMTIALSIATVTGLFFSVGLYRACRQMRMNIIPALTVISIPFSFAWVAIFPSGTELHSTGGNAMLLLYLGMLLALLLWRGKELLTMRLWSFMSLLLLLMIFLRFVPPFRGQYEGLVQRFAHLGWSVWFVALNICFIQLINNKSTKKITA